MKKTRHISVFDASGRLKDPNAALIEIIQAALQGWHLRLNPPTLFVMEQEIPKSPAARELTREALDRHLPRETPDEPPAPRKNEIFDPGFSGEKSFEPPLTLSDTVGNTKGFCEQDDDSEHPADYGGYG